MASLSGTELSQYAQKLFEDIAHNIVHEIVLQKHHDHKMLLASLDPTTRLPHCATCKLPILLDPPLAPKVRGAVADPPASTNYCDRKPWSRRAGHDIYGNPFLKSDVTGRPMTKKEREAAAKNSNRKNNEDGTPASEEHNDGTGPPSPSQDNDGNGAPKLEKGEKKASKIDEKLKKGEYVPWQTCPSCKRSLLITRFAKHLEQCMGLSGRQASRNAMAKMNGSSIGTPAGSRGGTPNPSQGDKDDDDEDELSPVNTKASGTNGGVRKKLLKKGLKDKVKNSKANGALPKSLTNKNSTNRSSPPAAAENGKRDLAELNNGGDADDGDEVHVKKRQKLQRVGSTASLLSQATTAPEMERGESNDGSFIADGASVVDE